MQPSSVVLFFCFMGVWIALGGTAVFLFMFGSNAEFKRRWFPRFVIFTGVLFFGFLTLFTFVEPKGPPPIALLIALPAIVLISYLNIKFTRFCGNCGKTIVAGNMMFTELKYCPSCGKPI